MQWQYEDVFTWYCCKRRYTSENVESSFAFSFERVKQTKVLLHVVFVWTKSSKQIWFVARVLVIARESVLTSTED